MARRLKAEQRRDAILRAALPVFARHGLHGTTTRMLAEAAGVSEALLYRHFPGKEALYEELGASHARDREAHPELERLLALPAGATRLASLLSYLVEHIADPQEDALARLMVQSLLADGRFARQALQGFMRELEPVLREDLEAAAAAGELALEPETALLRVWLVHHLALGLKLLALPPRGAVAYGLERRRVVREAVAFALRGLGLREGLPESPPDDPV